MNFTEKQIAEFKESFDAFDKSGGGTITKDSLGTVMRSLGCNITQADLSEFLDDVEKSGNDHIDFNKFLVFMSAQLKKPTSDGEDEVRQALEIFDVDGSGLIPVATFRHIMMNSGERLTAEEIDQVISLTSLNPDGKINIANFTAMIVGHK
ncbi:Calmodulin-alpha-like [Aphelenchoides besseyi]|nr:Calmodulin-alpha-like [Aphelenchoides besseyi]KAI6211119.1 Calmodulin-alpha-like [Aphelenchoides besseyi]